jgi:hypothetical protein
MNKICIFCKERNTYYKGKGVFYCKDCKKEFTIENYICIEKKVDLK